MPETSSQNQKPFSLEAFLKRSWPYLVAGAVLLLLVAGLIFRLVILGKIRGNETGPTGPGITAPTSTDAEFSPRLLDGVLVPKGEEGLLPRAVMIENSPDARPLSGISQASLVVEAPVEGGITRFMAVYDATTTLEQVGPVRSARLYYVELADALNAVYAHVGGSPEAIQKINSTAGFRNLDEFANGSTFWRSQRRAAPHNVYTDSELLAKAVEKKGWKAEAVPVAKFLPFPLEGVTSTRGDITMISVPYGGTFNASWTYDAEANRYTRKQGSVIQKDADGTVVSSTNVLVLQTEEQVLDELGRLKVRTTGSGRGLLYRGGHRFEITWRRIAGEWYRFESLEGGDVFLEPGQTWISLVTSPSQFPSVPTSTRP